jgi:hypothetical protein
MGGSKIPLIFYYYFILLMKIKEPWIAEPMKQKSKGKIPVLIEDWKVSRFVRNYPILTVQPNGWGYSNCILERMFEYEEVFYKFTEDGIRFSYYEKNGYKFLMKYIKFPEHLIPDEGEKNVLVLHKVSSLKYQFVKENRKTNLKVQKV